MFAGRRDTQVPPTVVPKFTPAAIPIPFAQRAHPPHPPNPASDEQRRMMWRWRWLIGLGTAVSMVVLLAVLWPAPAPVIQLAMLDAIGASRGSDGRELAALRQTWSKTVVASFSTTESARAWETRWPELFLFGRTIKERCFPLTPAISPSEGERRNRRQLFGEPGLLGRENWGASAGTFGSALGLVS